jgi:hypothetical protein
MDGIWGLFQAQNKQGGAPMYYTVDGQRYLLIPVMTEPLTRSPGGRPKLAGARMFKKKRYVGFWYAHNMPLGVVRRLQDEWLTWR